MGVGHKLLDRHRAWRDRGRIRFPGARLIPLHDDEVFFQLSILVSERHLWETGATVEKEQKWFLPVPAADLNPLIDSAEANFFERINTLIRFDRDLARHAVLLDEPHDDEPQSQHDGETDERKHEES